MKKLLSCIIVIFGLINSPLVVLAQTVDSYIKLITPNGGEVFKNGQTYVIQWEQKNIKRVDIALDSTTIARDYVVNPNSAVGEYTWLVPNLDQSMDSYKIRIIGYADDTGSGKYSESVDYFIINKKGDASSVIDSISAAPVSGVDTCYISWTQKRVDAVSIYYAKNEIDKSNLNYVPIVSNLPEKILTSGDTRGYYQWSIGNLPANDYIIKIEGYLNGKKTVESISVPTWIVSTLAAETFSANLEAKTLDDHTAVINYRVLGSNGDVYIDYGLNEKYGLSKKIFTAGELELNDLKIGSLYHYRVRNGKNVSKDQTFKTKSLKSPANLYFKLISKEVGKAKVRIYWDKTASQSNVYKCEGKDCYGNERLWTLAPTTVSENYFDTDVLVATSSWTMFRIKALEKGEEGGFSKYLVASTDDVEGPITVASDIKDGVSKISWKSTPLKDFYGNSGLIYSTEKSCLAFDGCGKVVSNPTHGLYYNDAEIPFSGKVIYYKIFAEGKIFETVRSVIPNNATKTSKGITPLVVPVALSEQKIIMQSGDNLQIIIDSAGALKNQKAQVAAMKKYTTNLVNFDKKITTAQKYSINNYIVYGTKSTKKFTQDRRYQSVKKFKLSFGKLPKTENDWKEVLKF